MVRSPEGPPLTAIGHETETFLSKFISVEWNGRKWVASLDTDKTIKAEGPTYEKALANLLTDRISAGNVVLQEIARQLLIQMPE